jgi:hypothetical protein
MSVKDIRPALRAFVLALSGVSSAVSGRMYPIRLPQGNTAGGIVYNRISGEGDHHNEGASGLARVRVQFDCWMPTHDAAAALALLVKAGLDGYRGEMGSGGSAVQVQGVFFDSERDLPFDDLGKLYGVSHDYFFVYEER